MNLRELRLVERSLSSVARRVIVPTAVFGLVLWWMWASRYGWWRVWHHSAQSLADATIFVCAIAILFGGARGLASEPAGEEEMALSGSRPIVLVWIRKSVDAVAPVAIGYVAAMLAVQLLLVVQTGSVSPSWLRLTSSVLMVIAWGVYGYTAAMRFRHPVVLPIAVLIYWFIFAFEPLGYRFLGDEASLGPYVKTSGFLLAQVGVALLLLIAGITMLLRRHSLALVTLAAMLGFMAQAGTVERSVLDSELAAAECRQQTVIICSLAVHEHLLEDFDSALGDAASLADAVSPIAALVEYEVEPDSLNLGIPAAGRAVLFSSRGGVDVGPVS